MSQPQAVDRRLARYAPHLNRPLAPVIEAALKRRKVTTDERLASVFVEAALRRAHPGNLLSELYRVQFEDAIDEAIATLSAMTLDECIDLALAENTAEPRNIALQPGTGAMDLRSVQRQLRALNIEGLRAATPSEQAGYGRASGRASRRPRERVSVSVIEDAPPRETPSAPIVAGPAMPILAESARTFLDRQVAGTTVKSFGALRTYVGYLWPVAHGRRDDLPTDKAIADAYVAAVWPTYAAAHGLAVE